MSWIVGGTPVPQASWRDRLGRRLAQFTAVITPLVFAPVLFGTEDPSARMELVIATVSVFGAFVYLARRGTAPVIRSVGVVAAFSGVGVAGYATMGFLSAPGVAFALSVALAGLLLGRRAMIVAAVVTGALVVVVGTLMVRGVLPAPAADDISPELARPWLRSSAIMMVLIGCLGATVTWAVETIEAALERVRAAEAQVLEAQKREMMVHLAAGLAHDVNNQLTIISAWSSLMTSKRTSADLSRARETIADAISNASALTKQLLVLGRKDVQAQRPFGLAKLVGEFETALRGFLPADIALRIDADEGAWCHADEAQLNSVLLNLVLNARDAMPTGGTMTVRTARRHIDEERSSATGTIPPGDWAVLEVEDDGIGMDGETVQRALEPFFTTKGSGEGTGLGLATIAAIAEQNDGYVIIESTPGTGTRVAAWLPAVDPVYESAAAAVTAAPDMRGIRVLISEDAAGVLSAARAALSEAGCIVVAAADGDEALARVREGNFDVLCSDVVMPGAPVLDVIDAFVRKNPGARVLLCSGYVGEDLVRRGIEQGRYHFLQKPYTVSALVQSVAQAFSDRDARPPISA